MSTSMREMLEAGVHFGHQTRFWNPKMAPFIFGHRNRIHIINLEKSLPLFQDACKFARQLAANRGTILMVGTKRQAREILSTEARRAGVPFVDQRWLGGMLTNFKTVKSSIKRLKEMKAQQEAGLDTISKKEQLTFTREIEKLEKDIGGTPAAPINGATFDGAGKFTGFPHSEATKAAGTVNLRAYLAPTLGFSGIVYVKNFQTIQTVVDQIGKTSKSGMFAGLQLVYKKDSEWVIGSPGGASGNWDQLFLDSVNYEEFGLIYKINYTVRYFAYGFNPLVYSKASN